MSGISKFPCVSKQLFEFEGASKEKAIVENELFHKKEQAIVQESDFEIKENHSGKYTELIINSEAKNFEWQIYHTDSTEKSYETGKENRKNSNGFKEYEWNGKKGYIYNADKFSLDFNILLNTNDGDAKVLFGSLSYKDSTKADILNYFQSEEFQKIMNSIEFKE